MKDFTETLKGAMVSTDTKKVVQAASEGDLKAFVDAYKSYSWSSSVRDYSVVLIIFSPIVAAIRAVEKGEGYPKSSLENVLRDPKFTDLCTFIGEGDGKEIADTLNSFTNYRDLLRAIGDAAGIRLGTVFNRLIVRAEGITEWSSSNRSFIEGHLIPFVRERLGARLSSKILSRLTDVDSKFKLKIRFSYAGPKYIALCIRGMFVDPIEFENRKFKGAPFIFDLEDKCNGISECDTARRSEGYEDVPMWASQRNSTKIYCKIEDGRDFKSVVKDLKDAVMRVANSHKDIVTIEEISVDDDEDLDFLIS